MRRGAAILRAGLTAVKATPLGRPRTGVSVLRAVRLVGSDRIFTAAVTDRFIGVTGGSGSAAEGGGDSNRTRGLTSRWGLSRAGLDRRWRSILCQKNCR